MAKHKPSTSLLLFGTSLFLIGTAAFIFLNNYQKITFDIDMSDEDESEYS